MQKVQQMALEQRLATLYERGVHIVDPRQTYIDATVDLNRIYHDVILHPGTRLQGARTFLAPGAELGRQGPTVVENCVLATHARIESGYAQGAVLLSRAVAGANAHVRSGTLMEEEASTAHAVGLKQTILLAFVTLGSLINFCDVLMAGGRSRRDHSEVGSGFIHFNFTPWGAHGDKATPSLVGDVVSGVLLYEPRIFLGGAGGMVGPRHIDYGAITGAGQVLRQDVGKNQLVVAPAKAIQRSMDAAFLDELAPRYTRNVHYIAQLVALKQWYAQVRKPRIPVERSESYQHLIIDEALQTIDECIHERWLRLQAFAHERGVSKQSFPQFVVPACPLQLRAETTYVDHMTWVQALNESQRTSLREWLAAIVEQVCERLQLNESE